MKINPRVPVLREAIVKIANILAEKKVKVTQQGTMAFCEYIPGTNILKRVNIPYIPDDASDELIEAIQGFVDHELGHVLFTDGSVIQECAREGVLQFWNMIEDTYVERMMSRRFTGSASNLAAVGRMYVFKCSEEKIKEGKYLEGLLVPMVRAWAGQKVFQDFMSDKWHYLPELRAKLEPLMLKALPEIASSRDSFNLALEVKKLVDVPTPPCPPTKGKGKSKAEPTEEPDKGDGGEGDTGESEGSEGGKPKKSKKKSAKKEEPKKEEGKDKDEEPKPESKDEDEDGADGDPQDGADDPQDGADEAKSGDEPEEEEGEEEEGEEEEGEESEDDGEGSDAGKPEGEKGEDSAGTESASEKPGIGMGGKKLSFGDLEMHAGDTEYDQALADAISEEAKRQAETTDYLIYTTDHDTVEMLDGEASDAELTRMQNDVDHMVGPMQKDIERAIAARSASVLIPGFRSGKLHGSSLHKVVFDRDDVFRRKTVNDTKDVACELLIDMSGSMTHKGKLNLAAYAGYALSSVLDRMNIPNEVIGFTTRDFPRSVYNEIAREGGDDKYARLEALYMPIVKEFHERVGTAVKSRFAAIPTSVNCAENVDGECVMIAGRRLSQRREKRKILFVLSDGHPSCSGDWKQQLSHLKAVVKMLEAQKIETLGIGIMDRAVEQFYPKHVVLQNIAELPGEVMRQLKDLLLKAKLGVH